MGTNPEAGRPAVEEPRPTPAERRFRAMLTGISDTVSVATADGDRIFTTADGGAPFGALADSWSGPNPLSLVHPDDLAATIDAWQSSLRRPGVEVGVECRLRDRDGWAEVAVSFRNLLDDPDVGGLVITTRDITELRHAERLASSQAAVLELIATGSPLSAVFDACIDLVQANGGAGQTALYLLEGDRLVLRAGQQPVTLVDHLTAGPGVPEDTCCAIALATRRPSVLPDLTEPHVHAGVRALAERLDVAASWSHPIRISTADEPVGTLSTVYEEPHEPSPRERRIGELACSLVAIALERAGSEERLSHQALHDSLTGLPNRTLLVDRLGHAIERRSRSGAGIAVLFCDLDRFKVVNDSLGHGVGDELLVAFARRLQDMVDTGDTVARFGGDEFIVLLEDVRHEHEAFQAAERIASALEEPFTVADGQELRLTASVGLALPHEHTSAEAWLRDADSAMYRAKERGRNRLEVFDEGMRESATLRLQVENDLRHAVQRRELVLHYQPMIDLRTGRITGTEALVRWHHPRRGLLPPADFIEVAEDIGVIDELGWHVLTTAVTEMNQLRHAFHGRPFDLAVNLSARQLARPHLDRDIDELCSRLGWPTHELLLEVTETTLATDIQEPLHLLGRIRALGVRLAIDDFGTGHSSLTRLGLMPVDRIKIDRTFVAAIDQPGDDLARMVDAVVAIAAALDLRVTAEGVESQVQVDHLRRIHCEVAQGYYFSKPLPLDEFEALLLADPRW